VTGIEEFSLCAWATPHARQWNRRTGRGIIYRGWDTIGNSERFFATELRRKAPEKVDYDSGRGFTYGT
jgi:hypothetical protein